MTKNELVDIIKTYVAAELAKLDKYAIAKQAAALVEVPQAPDVEAIIEQVTKRIESPEIVELDVDEIVDKVAAMMPRPKDGVDGANGKDGIDGKDGVDGKDGADGRDGKDAERVSEAAIADAVAAKFERRFSDLVLSWERQARDGIERAIDRIPVPKDGKDGKDAAPIESLEITQNERHVTIKLGDVERTITLNTILDRGVWEQRAYEAGDAVSYGGSLWIAQQDTEDAPGTSKAWRLAVKKGRDGRDLRDSASKHDKVSGVKV